MPTRERGFTLVEMVVVVALLGILAAIAVPAVTNIGRSGLEAQVQSDARSMQTAAVRYDVTASLPKQWPEQTLGTKYAYSSTLGTARLTSTQSVVFRDKDGTTTLTVDTTTHSEVNFSASTTFRQSDGSITSLTFVPDFLDIQPRSTFLLNDEGATTSDGTTKLLEFLWLLKKTSVGKEEEARRVEIYRATSFSSNVITYTRVF